MRRNLLFCLAGFLLLGAVIAKIGWAEAFQQFQAVGIGVPVVIALSLLRLYLQTTAWATALRTEGVAASPLELMGVRLASQGMGYITPLGPVISEPMKVRLLGGNATTAAVATLVDTGTYWFSSGVVGVFASIGASLLVVQSTAATIALMTLAGVFIAGLVLMARPKPLLIHLLRALGHDCPSWLRKGAEVEAAIRDFAIKHPRAMRKMLGLDLACQLLLAAEVAVVFWALRIPLHAGTLFALEAVTRGAKMVTSWLPARIGADEGAAATMFTALGLSSASGLALALTRRSRDLLSCAIGFCWLAWKTKSQTVQFPSTKFAPTKELLSCRP